MRKKWLNLLALTGFSALSANASESPRYEVHYEIRCAAADENLQLIQGESNQIEVEAKNIAGPYKIKFNGHRDHFVAERSSVDGSQLEYSAPNLTIQYDAGHGIQVFGSEGYSADVDVRFGDGQTFKSKYACTRWRRYDYDRLYYLTALLGPFHEFFDGYRRFEVDPIDGHVIAEVRY